MLLFVLAICDGIHDASAPKSIVGNPFQLLGTKTRGDTIQGVTAKLWRKVEEMVNSPSTGDVQRGSSALLLGCL